MIVFRLNLRIQFTTFDNHINKYTHPKSKFLTEFRFSSFLNTVNNMLSNKERMDLLNEEIANLTAKGFILERTDKNLFQAFFNSKWRTATVQITDSGDRIVTNELNIFSSFLLLLIVVIMMIVLAVVVDNYNKKEEERKNLLARENLIKQQQILKEKRVKDSIYHCSPEYKQLILKLRNDSLKKVKEEKNDSIKFYKTRVGKCYKYCQTHGATDVTKEDCIRACDHNIWIGMNITLLYFTRGLPDRINTSDYGYGINRQYVWYNYDPDCFYTENGNDIVSSYN